MRVINNNVLTAYWQEETTAKLKVKWQKRKYSLEKEFPWCCYSKQNLRFVDQIRKYWENKNSHLFSLAACLLNFCHFWYRCHLSRSLWSWWLVRLEVRSFVYKEPCWRLELWMMRRILILLLLLLHHRSSDPPSLHQTSSCSKHDPQHLSETIKSNYYLAIKYSFYKISKKVTQ